MIPSHLHPSLVLHGGVEMVEMIYDPDLHMRSSQMHIPSVRYDVSAGHRLHPVGSSPIGGARVTCGNVRKSPPRAPKVEIFG